MFKPYLRTVLSLGIFASISNVDTLLFNIAMYYMFSYILTIIFLEFNYKGLASDDAHESKWQSFFCGSYSSLSKRSL